QPQPDSQTAAPARSTSKSKRKKPGFEGTPAPEMAEAKRQQTLMLLEQAWKRHQHRVMEQIDVLRQAATALTQQALSRELHQHAQQEAHTLAGSLGMFGFSEGSRLSREMENLLRSDNALKPEEIEQFNRLATLLHQEVCQSPNEKAAPEPVPFKPAPVETSPNGKTSGALLPRLLVVDSDRQLAESLVAAAPSHGIQVEIATSLESAREKVNALPPHAVLLDPTVSPQLPDSLVWLNALSQQTPAIPVIICTTEADLQERIEISRLGEHVWLQKPIASTDILKEVNQVLHPERVRGTVLIVDDDPGILDLSQSLLEPWGLKIVTLSDPQQFWDVLEATVPDLLILDIAMPQISGIELCRIVRNDARWSNLPILFLTAHNDAESINQVFTAGADDFISKPITGVELVTRTVNRLERIRQLKRYYTLPDPSRSPIDRK
ncbi:MAG TPA: response regulator, partial [Allocoleopsis sp.]